MRPLPTPLWPSSVEPSSQGFVDGLMDQLDVGVVVQDRDAAIIYTNRRAIQLLGVSSEEMLGRRSDDPEWDVVRPDGGRFPAPERPVAVALDTGRPVKDVVLGVLTPEGERSWLLANAVPKLAADGTVEHVVVTLSDISSERRRMGLLQQVADDLEQAVGERTAELAGSVAELEREAEQRRAAEQALARSESMYRSVLRAMAEGIVVHNPDGSIRYANPAAERILGMSLATMQSSAASERQWGLVRPDKLPLLREELPSERTRQTGEPCHQVMLGVRRDDGQTSWLLVNTDALDHPENPPSLGGGRTVITTFSDVTEVREANLALERSRQQFEHVTRAVPGVLYQALRRDDGETELSFVSAAARDVLGVSAEEIIARPSALLSCIEHAGRESAGQSAVQAQTQLRPWECEVQINPDHAEPRWIHNRAVPQRVEGGVVWSGVAFDVTDQRRLGDQVRVAQRREAIGAVTAGIAHNFNNALAVIVPNLEQCLADVPESAVRPLAESLRTARNAADLVRQLMFITRGGLGDERVPVDLADVVARTAAMFRRLLRGRVEVRARNEAGRVRVVSPRSALHQVLLNLCINAQDALAGVDAPWVELSVEVPDRALPGAFAVLKVRDNGRGMDAETHARLGEPFFTTKPPGAGTGLGLATAFKTVRELGGDIECRSSPGNGCEFTISIPVLDFGAPEAEVLEPEACFPPQDVGRLLLVDDEPLVRGALAKLLARQGHVIDQAGTGLEALERVRHSGVSYDAVLLDLSMPGLSGETVLATLAREAPELPVIVLSGFVEDPGALNHARRVLQKPVTTRTLTESIAELLSFNEMRG
ncbi:MAG: PAS domain S-box protein [Myxococcota bacterium]